MEIDDASGDQGDANVSAGSFGSFDDLCGAIDDVERTMATKKVHKRGIVYLPFIPPTMNPMILRRTLSLYGDIERMYLQPDLKNKQAKNRRKINPFNVKYSEGWVEFLRKRDAKRIAAQLNNQPIAGRKSSKFREYLWNMKYLSGFKWIHLCERLNHEKILRQQRLQAEISQAKKVANHFAESVDKDERLRRYKTRTSAPPPGFINRQFVQRDTQEESDSKKEIEEKRHDFLKNLFS